MASESEPIVIEDTEPEDDVVEPTNGYNGSHALSTPSSVHEPRTPTPTAEADADAPETEAPNDPMAVDGDETTDGEFQVGAELNERGEDDDADEEGDDSDSQSEGDSEGDDSGDEATRDPSAVEEDISHSPRADADEPMAVDSSGDAEPQQAAAAESSTATGEAATASETTSGVAATTTADADANGKPKEKAKPKSKRVHKAASPPPVAPPPLETIRLEIKLDPATTRDRIYEFDLVEVAAHQGVVLRPALPAVKIDDESEDEKAANSAEELAQRFEKMAAEEDKGKKKRKRKKYEEEQYDLHDGFIDDTELAIEERKFIAETKQKGFYVSSGEVALKKVTPPPGTKTPTKPGAKQAKAAAPPVVPIVPPQHPPEIPLSDKPVHKRSALARTLAALPGKFEARTSKCMVVILKAALVTPESPDTGKIVVGGYEIDVTPPKKDEAEQANGDISPTQGNPNEMEEDDQPPADDHLAAPSSPMGRGTKRKASLTNLQSAEGDVLGEPTRKRRRGNTMSTLDFAHPSFTSELVADLEIMRQVVEREEKAFGIKGKFPQHVKPLLSQISMRAVVRDEYDDPLWDAMPKIFPYNRFTMKKLIARTIFQSHTDLLHARIEELLVDLKAITEEGFERAQLEQKNAMDAWEAKLAKKKAEREAAGESAGPPVATENANASAAAAGADAEAQDKDKPPQQKYRMTEVIRTIIWNLVCLSNDIVTLANEKNKFENVNDQISEQGMRKILYQKIQAAFPDGWMNSSILSREVSLLKRKQGEQNMAEVAKTTS